jgi:enterochelin esterase-like enzyme
MKKEGVLSRIAVICILFIACIACVVFYYTSGRSTSGSGSSDGSRSQAAVSSSAAGSIRSVSYAVTYQGKRYRKTAYVYVPDAYQRGKKMNILYLMHGSTGENRELAETMRRRFDSWIEDGSMEPMLVVFPTYYPDRTFVTADYSQDYPLDHFFAVKEIKTVVKSVESRYTTYAENVTSSGIEASRRHRAFGGYSMGGVTTWDVISARSDWFAWFMPMAGDCWGTEGSDDDTADFIMRSIKKNGYGSDDFRVIAMVGGADGTKYSMIPQIRALRSRYRGTITKDDLIYWENEGGGHSEESFIIEVHHGLRYIFV